MKHLLLTSLTLIIMSGCFQNKQKLIIEFDESNYIMTGQPVRLNELEIGSVRKVELGETNKVLVTISVEKSVKIPSDSKFTMDLDFFGNASIKIIPGTNEQLVENGSRVAGSQENEGQTDLAPITRIVSEFFNQKETKQDSLLIELRRLNENLEKLLHKDNRSGGH